MKKLFVIRHAKSSWDDPLLNDSARPLNKRGKRDAPFMAQLLKRDQIIPDLIISSPAKRAIATAKIFAEELNYNQNNIRLDDNIYEAAINDLIKVIAKIEENINSVFLVGHNPSVTYLVNHITGQNIDALPTCGICGIEFRFNSWKNVLYEKGELKFFDYPKKYFK